MDQNRTDRKATCIVAALQIKLGLAGQQIMSIAESFQNSNFLITRSWQMWPSLVLSPWDDAIEGQPIELFEKW